ncbi:MAG: tyrosine-type recombinase/integrase, partial [Planctomycetes bacterium]|nr:tyrosine-type recombinase/integrase [Planctomycetota bacterium]
FVSAETAQAVMDALPSPAWRLAFALARWGGLRVPSEVTALTWGDVSWERGRFTVTAVKTAKHAGKGSRVAPIFPELAGPFREAFEAAEVGAVFCCPQYPVGTANQHYRAVILRALARAGVEPWPKLFVNLRATRASELVECFPAHVAAAWLGHSPEIARRHYLMVTEGHFARASGAAQKAAQQEREMPEMVCSGYEGESGKPALQGITSGCKDLHNNVVEPRGFEPLTC